MGRAHVEGFGRGQSSLGYLFGGGAPPQNPAQDTTIKPCPNSESVDNNINKQTNESSQKSKSSSESVYNTTTNPVFGVQDYKTNNYHRAGGQNRGNFVTNRLSTKVHEAPGGSSSLGYLFGGSQN